MELFDDVYKKDDERYSWLYANGYPEGPVKRLIEFGSQQLFSYSETLDAGCGLQTFAKYMKELGYVGNIIGVDVSSYIVKKAQYCKVIHSSLENIPIADSYFDSLFCCDVLEHIPEDRISKTLKEMLRLLKPGGYWLFSIGTGKSFYKGPKGENLHVTIKSPLWWENMIQDTLGTICKKKVKGGVLLQGNTPIKKGCNRSHSKIAI